jgi:hypothetical protein
MNKTMIDVDRPVDGARLRRHVWLVAASIVGSILTGATTVAVVLSGQRLTGEAATFVGLLLVACLSVLTVATLSAASTALTVFAYGRLSVSRAKSEVLEVQERLDKAAAILIKATDLLVAVRRSNDRDLPHYVHDSYGLIDSLLAQYRDLVSIRHRDTGVAQHQ